MLDESKSRAMEPAASEVHDVPKATATPKPIESKTDEAPPVPISPSEMEITKEAHTEPKLAAEPAKSTPVDNVAAKSTSEESLSEQTSHLQADSPAAPVSPPLSQSSQGANIRPKPMAQPPKAASGEVAAENSATDKGLSEHASQTHADSPAAQIEEVEHEIDDLLSVSLIHPDEKALHRRLPEPVAPVQTDESAPGIDLEMNAESPVKDNAPVGTPHHMAEHHRLKVIQPLEPIVPPKEKFAKELADLTASSGQSEASSPPAVRATPPSESVKPIVSKPPLPQTPVVPVPAPMQIVRYTEATLPPATELPPETPSVVDVETGLPPAESLAAGDVAKIRAEKATLAQQDAHQPIAQASRSERLPDTPPPIEAKHDKKDDKSDSKRRKHRRGGQKRGENSADSTDQNRANSGGGLQVAVPGKLILPTGVKPSVESVQPHTEKPKKLAPGEVYVDEKGNVLMGE
jgi:hypothetical protein